MPPSSRDRAMFVGAPPPWSLKPRKSLAQRVYDLLCAPLRMIVFPDHISERFHMTSLRAERLSKVLDEMGGRCLDVGAGDNMLINLYRHMAEDPAAADSVGVDVVAWDGDCLLIEDSGHLPFDSESFDTVTFVACLNHIPEREAALREAWRVLRPGGRVVVTMIGDLVGRVGHALWWYSEDKHREIAPGELMGMSPSVVDRLVAQAGFVNHESRGFVYGLNRMVLAEKPR